MDNYKELNNKRLLVLGGNGCSDAIEQFTKDNSIIVFSISNDPKAAIHAISSKKIVFSGPDLLQYF